MRRVRLIHWNPDETSPVIGALKKAKFEVEFKPMNGAENIRAIRTSPPDVVVIDLSRLPSHGREVAIALRNGKQTRAVPILFLGGAPEKVATVREHIPDATYADLAHLPSALRQCLKDAPANPVVPKQMMERYAGRTTAQKMGIAAGTRVAVVAAPRDYARVIGALPDNVEYDEESWADCAVTVWFVEDPESLLAALPKMRRIASASKLWVAWPKKSGRKDSLLTENVIRDMALERGLVDYKVCSVNETWSGLCLAVRRAT